jgi:hypothetical protein
MNKVKVLAPVKKADILVKDYKYDYAGKPVFVSEGGTGDTGAPLRGEGLAGGIGGALGALGGLAGQHRSLGSLANAMYFGGQQGSRMGRAARRKLSTAGQRARATERRNIGNEYADAVAQGRIKKPGMFTNIRERRPAGEVFSTGKHKREQLDNLREKTNQEEEAKRERQMEIDMRNRDKIRRKIDGEGKVAVEDTKDDDWSDVAVEDTEDTEDGDWTEANVEWDKPEQLGDKPEQLALPAPKVAVKDDWSGVDDNWGEQVAVQDPTDGLATDAAGNEVPNTIEQGLLPPLPPDGVVAETTKDNQLEANETLGADATNDEIDVKQATQQQERMMGGKNSVPVEGNEGNGNNTWWKDQKVKVQANNTTPQEKRPTPLSGQRRLPLNKSVAVN